MLTLLLKQDSADRLFRLIDQYEPRLREAFTRAVQGMQEADIDELANLIEGGRLQDAVQSMSARSTRFAADVNRALHDAAEATERVLENMGLVVSFDVTNARAVRLMQENRLRLIREFQTDQRDVLRQVMTRGIQQGLNPRDQARAFRASVGLTAQQEQHVANYERSLRERSRTALDRALRDRRFDPTVERAITQDRPLSEEQVQRMVGRYRERYIKLRAETIGRTEALRVVHQGSREMYQQAIESGAIAAQDIEREWHVRLDGREREWHATMANQKRTFGEPFITGQGYSIMYPGDPDAPASETVNCRCSVTTRLVAAPAPKPTLVVPPAPVPAPVPPRVVPLTQPAPPVDLTPPPPPPPVAPTPVPATRSVLDLAGGDVAAGHRDLRAWYENTRAAVTQQARKALDAYQAKGYKGVNSSLRRGRVTNAAVYLDEVFQAAPTLRQDTITYRVANLKDKSAQKLFGGVEPRPGAVFQDNGFVSTSLDRRIYDTLIATERQQGSSMYRFRIRSPEGTRAVVMRQYDNESEVLLNRGTRFRVVSSRLAEVREAADGKFAVYDVEVEVLP